MSTAVTMYQWRRAMAKSELPGLTKLVLHTLADFTNEFGQTCWPALDTIAERAGIAVRTATKHLRIARLEGWLDTWKSRRPDRRWAHSHYRLMVPGNCLGESHGNGDELMARDAIDVPALTATDAAASATEQADGGHKDQSENYWHETPTNNPMNGVTKDTSLSHTSEVYPGAAGERGEDLQESDAAELAAWMRDRVKAIDPECDEPNLRSWVCEIERMRTDDGRDERAMVRLFAWALRDKFWKRIITSPHRLRKHWAEVRRRRNAALEQTASTGSVGAATRAVDDRLCAHVDASGVRCTHVATILGIGVARRGYCRHHVGYYED